MTDNEIEEQRAKLLADALKNNVFVENLDIGCLFYHSDPLSLLPFSSGTLNTNVL